MDLFENLIGPARPISWALHFWPTVVAAFVFGFFATAACNVIALKLGITDKPDNLVKTHKKPVAYLGGVGILVGFVAGTLAGLYMMIHDPGFSIIFKKLLGIIAGATVACLVGVVDDIVDIRPWQKLLGQFIAAITLIFAGITPSINSICSPLGFTLPAIAETAIGVPIVIVFVLGATNSLNLLDGLDGLCGGVTAIITLGMLFLAAHLSTWEFSQTGDPVRIIVCLALVGGVMGFLPFNRHPAKIFMGDAGSLLLGFCVAALMMLFAEKSPRWLLASIVLFGLPILDTATALARRKLNGRPLMVSDRGHIYDQMMDRGYGLKKTVRICYIIAAGYAAIGLLMSQIRTRYALVVYCIVFILSALIIWKKGFLKMEGMLGAIKHPAKD